MVDLRIGVGFLVREKFKIWSDLGFSIVFVTPAFCFLVRCRSPDVMSLAIVVGGGGGRPFFPGRAL